MSRWAPDTPRSQKNYIFQLEFGSEDILTRLERRASENININGRISSGTVYAQHLLTRIFLQQEHRYFKTYAYVFANAVVFQYRLKLKGVLITACGGIEDRRYNIYWNWSEHFMRRATLQLLPPDSALLTPSKCTIWDNNYNIWRRDFISTCRLEEK